MSCGLPGVSYDSQRVLPVLFLVVQYFVCDTNPVISVLHLCSQQQTGPCEQLYGGRQHLLQDAGRPCDAASALHPRDALQQPAALRPGRSPHHSSPCLPCFPFPIFSLCLSLPPPSLSLFSSLFVTLSLLSHGIQGFVVYLRVLSSHVPGHSVQKTGEGEKSRQRQKLH